MGRELNLDQLAQAMRDQQEGKSNGKKIGFVNGGFQEISNNEPVRDTVSQVNDVSKKPFWA